MKAFHGQQAIKDNVLIQLQAHYEADEIIKGRYWENGKGCAVGCTIHSSDHSEYEPRFGIPQILARLEDGIFENLPNDLAKKWPIRFIKAIKPGADLSTAWPKFAVFLLIDSQHGVLQYAQTDEQKSAIQKVADLYSESNRLIMSREWRNAADYAARAADYAAAYAARAAACAARAAACAARAVDAARAADAAARAAACAARAARAADYAAADAAADADAAVRAARAAGRIAQADKLIELLKQCN